MKKISFFILVLIIVFGGYFYFNNQENNNKLLNTTQKEIIIPTSEVNKLKTYSLDEIAKHNSKEDCWFAIEGKVYNVTDYITSGFHPGKEAIIQGCGKDATILFNTRPMGSGTAHSEKARSFLSKFEIGSLSP